jgi:GT2 family glycosyltransferase
MKLQKMIIDIAIPVYQDLTVTRRCLDSVLGHRQQHPHEVIVIDDASPESELAEYLDELAEAGRLTLLRNPVNQGFAATANRGLALHPDRDVVLLNSDTEVNGDWLDRLARCAYAAATTGTVTPFSNNATICSYPRFCEANELPPGLSLAETDALFQRANAGRWLEIPTAVGFCMYVRRDCLQAVGGFDERAFSLGYGEENEFCMRATQAGWRHVLCADTFVYHVGGASFGERQAQLQAQAREALAALHPAYDERVQSFIREDPVRPLRMAVDWERALRAPEQALYVLRERDEALARMLRERHEILTREQRTTTMLEQALRTAETLVFQTRDELQQYDQALADAQRYVRERQADIAELTGQIRATQSDLEQAMRQIESLREQNRDMTVQLDAIHASRVWRYTEFLRRS